VCANFVRLERGNSIMRTLATLCILGAFVCFAAFFANIALGAAKRAVFLGDIPEMLLLLLCATLFVGGTLAREALAQREKTGAR
jgi:hypothetical protein